METSIVRTNSVIARNPAFVSGFVKNRATPIHVTGEVQWCSGNPESICVEDGNLSVKMYTELSQPKRVELGPTPHSDQGQI